MLQVQIQEYFMYKGRKGEEVHHGREKLSFFLVRENTSFVQRKIEQICLYSEWIQREIQTCRECFKCLHYYRRQINMLSQPQTWHGGGLWLEKCTSITLQSANTKKAVFLLSVSVVGKKVRFCSSVIICRIVSLSFLFYGYLWDMCWKTLFSLPSPWIKTS